MTLLTYVRDADSDVAVFAIAADDTTAEYVWAPKQQPWFDGKLRNEYLAQALNEGQPPSDEQGWLGLATSNLGDSLIPDAPFDDLKSLKDAINAAKGYLKMQRLPQGASGDTLDQRDAHDQVAADYPGFAEHPDGVTPEALDNFVAMSMGPIDPDGPNGWILRAQDDQPADGDENEYLHFPETGTMEPEQEGDE